MLANDSFHIAVLPGDGIGPEVMAPALAVLEKVAASTPGLKFRFTEAPAGAGHYRDTGKSMPATTIKLCEEADAILLGACGLPHIRYPDNTEIMPQVELRFIFDLYAGVRPCRDAGHHAQDLAAAVRLRVSPGAPAQGARRSRLSHLRR
jgi:3-isopropylmalate dehydrogenase